VLFCAVFISFHCWFTGMVIYKKREKLFNKAFYEKHFPNWKSNKACTLDNVYPDQGEGRISDKLNDEDWFTFKNYHRAHYNYLEGLTSIITALIIAGLALPRITALLGFAYIIGRELYSQGYRSGGSKGRMFGVLIVDITLISLWGIALYASFNWGGGINGFISLFQF